MRKMFSILYRNVFGIVGLSAILAGLVITFFPVLSRDLALVSPDAMPFFVYPYGTLEMGDLLTGSPFTPYKLYWLFWDPLFAHEFVYIGDTVVLALGIVFYLRALRVHPLAAWFGGVALGLSGYTFTLFCAGHRGYFHMFSCAVWTFGLLYRCFATRRLIYFAYLGLIFAWGASLQPDVMLQIGFLAVGYTLWCTLKNRRQIVGRIVAVWPRFLMSFLVLALAGFAGIRSAVTTQMASRDAQIAEAVGRPAGMNKEKGAAKQDEHERWLFATNWSLPPEDFLEFWAPGVFGDESMQMPFPYWGRLGRPDDEKYVRGRMMPNYRQHTVYIGVVSLLFALFGVVAFCSRRKETMAFKDESRDGASLTGDTLVSRPDYSDVPFWCVAWFVCLLFAMGRYTPVYQLFYAVPYLDHIRCPVKFLHLVEIATAVLAAFGADTLLRTDEGSVRLRSMFIRVAWAISVILGVLALVAFVCQSQIVKHVAELGLGRVAQPLSGYAVRNLLRAAGLAALTGTWVLLLSKTCSAWRLGWGVMALMAVFVLDQATVARRYVKVIDVGPLYRENAVVRTIKKSSSGQVVNTINYVTPNAWGQDWFSCSLEMNGVRNMMPTAEERETVYGHMFDLLQKDVAKLWRVLNVQYVVVPRKGSENLVRAGIVRPEMDFELGNGTLRQVAPNEKSMMLASVVGNVAGARAFSEWKGGVSLENQPGEMVRSEMVVTLAPQSDRAPKDTLTRPRLKQYGAAWGTPWRFATDLNCESDSPALIIFNQKFEKGWEVLVDQEKVPCYPADGFWLSAVAPAGTHHVVVRKTRNLLPGVMSFGVSVLVLLAGVMGFFFPRNCDDPVEMGV